MFKMTPIRSFRLARIMAIITFVSGFLFAQLISLAIFYMTFYSINYTTDHIPYIERNTGLPILITGGVLILL
jgi:hypothetical protein